MTNARTAPSQSSHLRPRLTQPTVTLAHAFQTTNAHAAFLLSSAVFGRRLRICLFRDDRSCLRFGQRRHDRRHFYALTFVPRLFSSFLGAVAYRCGKALCLSLSALSVALLWHLMSRTTPIGRMYALWFVASFFLTFIVNARSALMAEILTRQNYAFGNTVSLTLLNGAKRLGPLAGGLCSMSVGPHRLLRFAGVVYLLTAAVALGIGSPRNTHRTERSLMRTLEQGIRFMRGQPAFRQMAAIAFL